MSETGNIDANLKLLQNKLDLMSRFMIVKFVNPKLRQNQIAKELDCSSSTLQRYRNYIKMLLPYAIPSISHKRSQKILNKNLDDNSHRELDFK